MAAVLATVPALTLAAGLAGCGSGSTPGASTDSPATSLPPEPPPPPQTDDKGRGYDLGTIRTIKTESGVQVLILDRWTVKKVSDAKLAKDGVPIRKYRVKKSPYTNQNTTVTFRIPVADHPVVVLRHCLAWDEPLQAKSTTLKGLAAAGGKDKILLVTLDERGWLTSAQNLPGC